MAKVALLGTGLMGAPMARNLVAAGHDLTVWNRSRAKAEGLGAAVADTPAEAVAGAAVVISMLSDGPASDAVQVQAMDAFAPGAIWVEMGSIKPEEARAHAARFAERGIGYVDAPVSGGTKGAEAGTLAIMAGGDAKAFAAVESVLNDLGRAVHVGPIGAGQLSKLANQAIVACTIGAVAEAMLLLEQGGADPAAVRDALKGGFADSTILQQHGQRMTERNFEPGGLTKFQIKDLDNVLAEADGLGLELPTVRAINDRFKVVRDEMAGGDWDHSALFLELRARNGL
ncbi:NAD(P)-dependent oxidoreductase [Jannaschia seohaensis]|uniref:2-hydroxy-3-oxopropionate reductase n=1 Tax=Jannaschia seohaensis TaxID=475081 RepID=A0A2Y9C7K3_9RHOB|nr:NAD(P)-dependent oxidoreductase [Jannaschia seohaensis]PWJ19231.1 2-hydroxy-3-oxopropionate reductase [Jannaschia seohaensis]SSA45893.1 2-hydroxy-3-oxopropionate reductase [Jannaschia seohaensis]